MAFQPLSLVRIAHDRPAAELEATGRRPTDGPWRRRVVAAVSVLTALWLLAQALVAASSVVQTWPVVAFPMFSAKRTSVVDRDLLAVTRGGRQLTVGPADFGLTDLQLVNYERGMVSDTGMVGPLAAGRLERLALAWNRGHPSDPAVSMTLTGTVSPVRPGAHPTYARVVRWSAP
ncbi:MAG TPA: hypothetical protein VFD04_08245 [Actinomycetes bacterium]|jgi:hypothetical protein|nr:hypothetical protein [Actinomycetes bacterium]